MAAQPLGPRQAAVLALLQERPGLTAGELARMFGMSKSLHRVLYRLERQALVVAVTAWEPSQGRQVSRWHPAPPGMVPPVRPADPEAVRRRREAGRRSQQARRARARGRRQAPAAAPLLPGTGCRDADPELFFPSDGERAADARRRVAEAVAVCAGCPVRRRCYQLADARGERWGVWGGVDFTPRPGTTRRAS